MISGQFRRTSLSRSVVPVQCNAHKGFGSGTASKRKGTKSGQSKTPQQAADRALAEASRSGGKARPIDPREAARGKVDYVQVKDWANGQAADIGELRVVPGSVGTGYATGSIGAAATAAAAATAESAAPFYQQLAQHAQYLERQGALSIANEAGAKPYLPFEAWRYSLQRYSQYLAEVAAVHTALEEALQLALLAAVTASTSSTHPQGVAEQPSSTSSNSSSSPELPSGREGHLLQAYSALESFGPSSGLWRAAAAQTDLQTVSRAAAAAAAGAGPSSRQQQQDDQQPHQQQLQQVKQKHKQSTGEPRASQNAVAYGRYLLQLGKAAATAATAATGATAAKAAAGPSGRASLMTAEAEDEAVAAVLKLLAHAYALQVQQQCLGTRIGAAATEKLQLLQAGAVALYVGYPEAVKGEPVQRLMQVTDAAGRWLGATGRQAVMEELPKALKKSALVLAPLATAE